MMLDRVYRAHSWSTLVIFEGSFLLGRYKVLLPASKMCRWEST